MAFYHIEVVKNWRYIDSDGSLKVKNPNIAVALSEDGGVMEPDLPKANRREFGRKVDVGQEYTNRWAISRKSECVDSSGKYYILSESSNFNGGSMRNFEPVVVSTNSWDGTHLVHGYVAHYPGGPGTRPYWRVYVDCWIFDYSAAKPLPTRVGGWVRLPNKRLNQTTDFRDDLGNAYQQAMALYGRIMGEAMLSYSMSLWKAGTVQVLRMIKGMAVPTGDPVFSTQPEYWADAIDLNISVGKGFNQLLAEAYMDAFASLPDISGMNNAVNAIQLVQAGLSIGKSILNPSSAALEVGSLREAWLAYRYSYGTTKSDIMEIASYFSRAADLIDSDIVRSNGMAVYSPRDNDIITVKCSIEVGQSELTPLKSTIERYGLQMDGYALWDLVPWSFVADWFLDVGGALERARSANFARRLKKGCWCSIERRWLNEFGFDEIYYRRFFTTPTVSYRTLQRHEVSGATIVKRGLDALALFT